MTARLTLALALLTGTAISAAHAQTVSVQRGRTFVQTHCASCHSITPVGPSPIAIAPPLRTLHERYRIEDLAEAFAEGISTGHPTMPEFRLDPGQIEDLIAFLNSLRPAP